MQYLPSPVWATVGGETHVETVYVRQTWQNVRTLVFDLSVKSAHDLTQAAKVQTDVDGYAYVELVTLPPVRAKLAVTIPESAVPPYALRTGTPVQSGTRTVARLLLPGADAERPERERAIVQALRDAELQEHRIVYFDE